MLFISDTPLWLYDAFHCITPGCMSYNLCMKRMLVSTWREWCMYWFSSHISPGAVPSLPTVHSLFKTGPGVARDPGTLPNVPNKLQEDVSCAGKSRRVNTKFYEITTSIFGVCTFRNKPVRRSLLARLVRSRVWFKSCELVLTGRQ